MVYLNKLYVNKAGKKKRLNEVININAENNAWHIVIA